MAQLLVLAAGKGSRMGTEQERLPKFLREFGAVEASLPRLVRQASAAEVGRVTVLTRSDYRHATVSATEGQQGLAVIGLESPGRTAGETLLQHFPDICRDGIYVAHADTWFAENPFVLHSDAHAIAIGGGESIIQDQPLGHLIETPEKLVVDYARRGGTEGLLAWTGLWFCPARAEPPKLPQNEGRVLVETIMSEMTAALGWVVMPVGAFANVNTPEDADALVRFAT
jgi:CTP:molybdopterin cytidylyltransferase MocA